MEPSSERGEGDGGGAAESRGHKRPARSMADIARLFMEGARPLPVRTPPAWRTLPTEPKNGDSPRAKPVSETRRKTATTALGLANAGQDAATWKLLVKAAQGLAEEQSTTVALVGLFSIAGKMSFVTDVVGVESAEELPVIRTAQEGSPDMQIARALHRLQPAIGLWIIAAPAPEARSFAAISSIVPEWMLVCPTTNDGLITGYQHLKHAWAAASRDNDISPKVYLLTEDYAQAAVVHRRLRQAAQEFLGTDLAFAGAGPIPHGGHRGAAQEPIRILSIPCNGPEDALWAAVLDELCPMTEGEEAHAPGSRPAPPPAVPVTDIEAALERVAGQAAQVERSSRAASEYVLDHLAHVLDPEERAALAADFEEPGVAVARPREREDDVPPVSGVDEEMPAPVIIKQPAPAAVPASDAEKTMAVPVAPVPVEAKKENVATSVSPAPTSTAAESAIADDAGGPMPLRVFDLEEGADRAALWQAVERSIWNLSPRSALLDAKPPMSWATDTCLAIDAAGRVNVWTLYRDGTSWFALREWANEHRNLLALTRRDLVVDKQADVAVHIVLPADYVGTEGEGSDVVPTLLRTAAKNIYMYRLRHIQWNRRRGLLVVPIS